MLARHVGAGRGDIPRAALDCVIAAGVVAMLTGHRLVHRSSLSCLYSSTRIVRAGPAVPLSCSCSMSVCKLDACRGTGLDAHESVLTLWGKLAYSEFSSFWIERKGSSSDQII